MTLKHGAFVIFMQLIIIVCVLAGIDKKAGNDAYWQNRLSFADGDAVINDSLVAQFVNAPESFPIDEKTGDIIYGSTRRAYSADHNIGRLLTVDIMPFAVFGEQRKEMPVIHEQLVFDLKGNKR